MPFKFIDLFAGLGGFHLALNKLGGECVFASEIKEDLQQLYKINFPNTPIIKGDITKVPIEEIPPHDILCAGFPCQPFSQAGKRQGFNDEKKRGNLFDYICEILEARKPEYVLLENVSNLKGHDKHKTWETIQRRLDDLHYWIKDDILSPHQYGIPQHRRRIYIVCRRKDLGTLDDFETCDISKIIEAWQEFIDQTIKHGEPIPKFPIWAMEFGADYNFEEKAPAFQTLQELQGRRGKLGQIIKATTVAGCLKQLPIYAQNDKAKVFPHWKIRYIQQNREFYYRNRGWVDVWLKKVNKFNNSHLKMEWNCGNDAKPVIEDKIIQFRASGIRIKLPTFSPALNLVGTQIPIFPWVPLPKEILINGEPEKGRYMTRKEAAKLQGLQDLIFGNEYFSLSQTRSFEALGNAVNATIIKHIAKNLLNI
jgi:DNA (cytosine-5)-methyltransferase 1